MLIAYMQQKKEDIVSNNTDLIVGNGWSFRGLLRLAAAVRRLPERPRSAGNKNMRKIFARIP